MLQEVQEINPTTRKLRISIPSEVIDSELSNAYGRLNESIKVPGFRPGKAPRSILEKKYGKSVEGEVIEKVIPEYYNKALRESDLEPVDHPSFEGELEIKANQPLSFTLTVEVKPDMSNIKYDGIALEKKVFTVEDEEINKALESLRESKVLFTPSETEVEKGDIAVVNAEAFIDGKKDEAMSQKDFTLLQGAQEVPKEFSEAILGKKKGDVFEVKLNYGKGHPNSSIAGKEVLFRMEVTETKKRNIPPLDDILANEFECETLDGLKFRIRDDISKRKESEINLSYKKDIINRILKENQFDAPSSMVAKEIDTFVGQLKESASRRGEAARPDDEVRRSYEPTAMENVRSVILIEAIGKRENITVTDEEIRDAIKEIAERHGRNVEEVTKLYHVREGSMDALKSRLFADKVLQYLLDKAVIK
ncbi:MAG: trigger factor [Nitrospirae bacterium]|nr:trigger factor [Nitrospirota bacterium]